MDISGYRADYCGDEVLLRNFQIVLTCRYSIIRNLFYLILTALITFSPYIASAQENPTGDDGLVELYQISIQNIKNGEIAVVETGNLTWETIGHIIYPTQKVNYEGYTASLWAQTGEVAAVAANAIHIKTGNNNDKGVIFSVVPKEMLDIPSHYNSFNSPNSSIYTDVSAGESIFGGEYSPFVGNKVFYLNESHKLKEITERYVPKIGDILVIKVERPRFFPKSIIFENKFGGAIKINYGGDFETIIGEVLKPVQGVGRFTGTQYVDVGRIRANHTGVIDISTSPLGKTGGFQIIPSAHGMSKEMINARISTQWMVIGPISVFDKSLEGLPPFFGGYLQPRYKKLNIDSPSLFEDLLDRFLVDVKIEGEKDWVPMPRYYIDPDLRKPLPSWANTAFRKITHIRILFPVND